ncbi:probable Cell division control protein 45 [Zygosaccharomyces bailii]|nr:probable Cell division control protein 45 [Zygosaccharomyces bailii]
MYYEIRHIAEPYHQILQSSSSHSSCQLVIFVSCLNIDALCAAKMLTNIFKGQLVQSQLVPVFGYAELKEHYLKLDEDVTSVIFVGCGGGICLDEFLEIHPEELIVDTENSVQEPQFKRHIYVFDSHRPWNLDNLFGSEIVVCLDDGTVEESLEKQKEAYFKLMQLDATSDEQNESQEQSNEDEDTQEDEPNEEEDTNVSEEEDVGGLSNKRPNSDSDSAKKKRKQRKQLIDEYETILEDYYSQGTSVVNSTSLQVYSLITTIGESSLKYLWWTILGVSSLDTTYPQVYNQLYPLLLDEVKRLSPSHHSAKTPDTLSLSIQPDYYLFLLRHSSLYDSFYYSNYVNAKLSLWNENGKKKLHKMFARMGIPLSTAQETWIYMDNSIKRELGMIFDRNLNRYGLQDIVRDGFVRTLGYRGAISASEFVEALTALLEVGTTIIKDSNETVEDISVNTQKKWVSNFWLSWDALDDGKVELLNRGIRHAQTLQKAVFGTGVAVLEKKLIKHLRIYRLCVLQEGPDLELYYNPLTLLRLGNWLSECCAESESKQLLPMVLASLNAATDTYLVAGLAPRYPRGMDVLQVRKPILNNFSMAFQQIAAQTDARIKIDNFESSIIEIRREDLSPFLEKLTLSGLI